VLRAALRRLAGVLKKRQHEDDFQRELEANLQFHIDDNIRAGMTPAEARRQALLRFGSVDSTAEAVRERRGVPFLETLARDVGYTLRLLRQNKAWAAVAIVALALGIGANTAIFNAANSLFLKQLPVADPDRLVRLRWAGANDMATSSGDYGYSGTDASGRELHGSFSYSAFDAMQRANQTMDGMFAFTPMGNLNVVVEGNAEIASGLVVSGDYFRVLRVRPVLGREIMPDDDNPSATSVAMLSYSYWMTRFGGDPLILGKTAVVTGTPATIIGITPPGFLGVQRMGDTTPADIILPLNHEPRFSLYRNRGVRANQPSNWWLYIMGRLKSGATASQVEGNLNSVFQQAARDGWKIYFDRQSPENQKRNANRTAVPELRVDAGGRGLYEIPPDTVTVIRVLSVVSGLILLIVCANLANLLLSRAAGRQREISVRLSLGASRSRLIQQLLTESVILASIGGALGVVVSYWCRELLPWAGPLSGFDVATFGFATGISFATGILFGIAPAFRATRVPLATTLKDNTRGVTRSRNFLSKTLIVVQVAVSLTILVSAGLLLRTLLNLRNAETGLSPSTLLVFQLNPLLTRYDQPAALRLYERVTNELEAQPGIQSVSVSEVWILTGHEIITSLNVPERQPDPVGPIHTLLVGPKFFSTMGIPLLQGREFVPSDNMQASKVAIINEATARKYFNGENPIGQRIDLETNKNFEIVGIARDGKYANVRKAADPAVFLAFLQNRIASMSFEVRTTADPALLMPQVRESLRRIDADLPVMNLSTHAAQIEDSFAQERFLAQAYTLFGVLAATLAGLGLFGVLSYSVVRRTNEIGIRMAIGAHSSQVMQMVLRESLLVVVLGIVLGIAGSLVANRLIATLLFGVASTDVLTLGLVSAAMIAISALAAFVPARRASRIDPSIALRHE